MEEDQGDRIVTAQQVMQAEAAAIQQAAARIGHDFNQAVELILKTPSKLVICGIGKSGHIGCKLAATFSSSGIPTIFLHAAEAIHGDLGIYKPGDPTILLSKSGSTAEVLRLMPLLRQFKSPIIAIVGNVDSPIAQQADVVLDASVEREADPLNLMPTSSSTVSLALGDALAAALVQERKFTAAEFATYHPGGQLGRNLLLQVKDLMHPASQIACVPISADLREVVIAMTNFPLGAACIVGTDYELLGIITDGDVRRILAQSGDVLARPVSEWMTQKPIVIKASVMIGQALRVMEDRASQISVLPVVADSEDRLLGLLRIHDAYQPTYS
jgi:arabinose-5-phosphate isomerase